MDVPQLAVRMLGGCRQSGLDTNVHGTPLADAAVVALNKARKEARIREEERNLIEKYKKLETGGRTSTK
jgi:hypothetical protein